MPHNHSVGKVSAKLSECHFKKIPKLAFIMTQRAAFQKQPENRYWRQEQGRPRGRIQPEGHLGSQQARRTGSGRQAGPKSLYRGHGFFSTELLPELDLPAPGIWEKLEGKAGGWA